MILEHSSPLPKFTRLRTSLIIIYAWFSIVSLKIVQAYPIPFFFIFLKDKGLETTIGLGVTSLGLFAQLVGPYFAQSSPRWKALPLWVRNFICILITFICNTPMCVLDYITNNVLQYTLIALTRSIVGLVTGILFVESFGEVLERFITNKSAVAPILSSAIPISFTIATITGANSYSYGGWTLAAPGISAFLLLPIALLPVISASEKLRPVPPQLTQDTQNTNCLENLTLPQKVALYLPDMVVFCNAYTTITLGYNVIYRATEFAGWSIEDAAMISSMVFVVGFIASLICSVLSQKLGGRTIFPFIFFLLTCFYGGIIMTYGSTTPYMSRSLLIPGSIITGAGTAAHMALTVPSQFVLCSAWGVPTVGLSELGARWFNVMVSLPGIPATFLAGLPRTRAAEIPFMGFVGAVYSLSLGCYVVCWVMSRKKIGTTGHRYKTQAGGDTLLKKDDKNSFLKNDSERCTGSTQI